MTDFTELRGVLGELQYVFGDLGPPDSSSCNIPSEALQVLLRRLPELLTAYEEACYLRDYYQGRIQDYKDTGLLW